MTLRKKQKKKEEIRDPLPNPIPNEKKFSVARRLKASNKTRKTNFPIPTPQWIRCPTPPKADMTFLPSVFSDGTTLNDSTGAEDHWLLFPRYIRGYAVV
ncbi:hypothetical protein P170DRAFT_94932 [Aspergillus steynii IBT 23096]|uniref:Uncharacterized protein n=1 Tax=Aspergillus steynii IBT 23096 TaxID=1392250 RepID=A0A2I2GGJ9_9EURO|nr:uncharacterized protein P170DRAFT_94932 [Aspergillus steynii IBT 23096]PLB51980.1 hypothetical protein P170DRAFT_94932 [Aspergillus steynii IBT 23096]